MSIFPRHLAPFLRRAPSLRSASRVLVPLALLGALGLGALSAAPPANLDRALAAQQKLVNEQPTAQRWNDLGNLLALAGRSEEAEAAYEQAIELDEDLASAHYNLGLLQEQRGSRRKALGHFRQVVELTPDDAWAWFQIGAAEEAAGDESSAIEAYAQAYSLDPRLSFPDVNPQVLDSKLVTQSLLAGQRRLAPTSEALRSYEDPKRIAGLLLPAPPGESANQRPAAEATAEAKPSSPAQQQPRTTATPPATTASRPTTAPGGRTASAGNAPGGSEAERTIRPQDLDRNSQVGGVTAPGIQGSVTHLPPSDSGYVDELRQRLLEQQEQQEQLNQEQNTDDVPAYSGDGGNGDFAPPGVYIPGPRSTGQLGYELDPRQ